MITALRASQGQVMRLYGYCQTPAGDAPDGALPLAEVSVVADPDELRRIAAFLAQAADTMERMGADYGHEHLCDRQPGFGDAPQWVVVAAAGQA